MKHQTGIVLLIVFLGVGCTINGSVDVNSNPENDIKLVRSDISYYIVLNPKTGTMCLTSNFSYDSSKYSQREALKRLYEENHRYIYDLLGDRTMGEIIQQTKIKTEFAYQYFGHKGIKVCLKGISHAEFVSIFSQLGENEFLFEAE